MLGFIYHLLFTTIKTKTVLYNIYNPLKSYNLNGFLFCIRKIP